MANYTAQDVKKLREETDAPMMECKAALDEADGDFEKAKTILREKGKAAAAKRADRTTSEGFVATAVSADGTAVGAVVLECETDFVAKNDGFREIANELAQIFVANDPGTDPLQVAANGKTVGEIVESAVAKIRENIKISKAVRVTTDGKLAVYVHHDGKKGTIIEVVGNTAPEAVEAARQIAIQAVAFPPEFLTKDEVPQSKIDHELEVETQRAINEGKDEKIARNIAMGRINKEYLKKVVLLEQNFYKDEKISVAQFLKEHGHGANVKSFVPLAVGEGA